MGFQWQHYIDVAEHLIDMGEHEHSRVDSEAYYRAAASRAYYAILKSSEDWAMMQPGSTYSPPARGADSHLHLIDFLRDNIDGNPTISSSVYRKMMNLKRERKNADYEGASVHNTWDKNRAEIAVIMSKQLCNNLPTYRLK